MARQVGGARGRGTRVAATMRPISVPRVPIKTPGENIYQWVDLWNCYYRERVIFVPKAIDDEMGNQLVGTMLYLDSENSKDMMLYINCPGGDLVPSLAIYDTMQSIKSKVGTLAFGGAQAMGGFLLAAGAKGKRLALQNTRIMLHHPSGTARGAASDMINEARELLRIRTYLNESMAKSTGQPVEVIAKDMQRDNNMTPQKAIEYGVIDKILLPKKLNVAGY